MTTQALLDALAAAGVELRAEGGRLRLRAPTGALTDELRASVGVHRHAVVELLEGEARGGLPARVRAWPAEQRALFEERAGIIQFSGGLDRELAEREAERCVRAEHARVAGQQQVVDPEAVAVAHDAPRGGPYR